jgi:hypothetical protein
MLKQVFFRPLYLFVKISRLKYLLENIVFLLYFLVFYFEQKIIDLAYINSHTTNDYTLIFYCDNSLMKQIYTFDQENTNSLTLNFSRESRAYTQKTKYKHTLVLQYMPAFFLSYTVWYSQLEKPLLCIKNSKVMVDNGG